MSVLKIDPRVTYTLIPAGFKAGKLYSQMPNDGTADYIVERNSIGTRINKDGLIVTEGVNVPRVDWSTGEPTLLIEGQSTNLVPSSEPTAGGSNVEWEDYNWACGFTKAIKPTSTYPSYYSPSVSLTAGETYVFSAFIEKFDGTKPVYGSAGDYTISLVNNQVPDENASAHHVIGNIWRVVGYGTAGTSGGSFLMGRKPSFRMMGFQIESGVTATSYIPTNGASVTRMAEAIYSNKFVDTLNDFSFVMESDHYYGPPHYTSRRAFEITMNNTTDLIFRYANRIMAGSLYLTVPGADKKMGVTVQGNTLKYFSDGVKRGELDISSVVRGSFQNLFLGTTKWKNNHLNGHIKFLIGSSSALTDEEMIELTTL